MGADTVAANDRIVAILEQLVVGGSSGAWGVRQLADEAGVSRSTAGRTLQGLAELGLATADSNGTYSAGPRLRVIAGWLHQSSPVLSATVPIAQALAQRTEATVIVALHAHPRPLAFIAVACQHPGPVRYSLDPGDLIPLHAGAAGRAVLGHLGSEALGAESLEQRTPDTITDRTVLETLLAEDRRRGFVVSVGQQLSLAAGVSAPFVLDGLPGSISITKPRYLASDEDLLGYGPLVRESADQLGKLATHSSVTQHLDRRPATGATALERMASALALLAALPGGVRTGKTLALRIGANIATTSKLVQTLERTGLARLRGDIVRAGPTLLRWAATLGQPPSIATLIGPELHDLVQRTGKTIGLTAYDSESQTAYMVEVLKGAETMHYSLASGVPIPLYAGAAGKAILAYCPAETVGKQSLEPYTERTPTTQGRLHSELHSIRERGYAVGDGERIPDAYGISAAYFVGESVAGSITATIPRSHLADTDIETLANTIIDTTAKVTRLLSL